MSSRALRRLREEQEAAAAANEHDGDDNETSSDGDDDEFDDDDDDNDVGRRNGGVGFASFLPSDDESSSSSSEEEEAGGDGTANIASSSTIDASDLIEKSKLKVTYNNSGTSTRKVKGVKAVVDDTKENDDFDDFDAIIESSATEFASTTYDHATDSTIRSLLLSDELGFDVRDLDSDRAMRSLPLGGGVMMGAAFDGMWDDDNAGVVGAGARGDGRRQRQQQRMRRHHRKYVFGMPRPEWGKPPSYVGGGIGTFEEPPTSTSLLRQLDDDARRDWSVPWPYNLHYDTAEDSDNTCEQNADGGIDADDGNKSKLAGLITPNIPPLSKQKWFTLKMSDTYQSDDIEYRTMLSSSLQHDPNLLAMFVADHPYYAEAMLQLAMVLQYVDDRARGNELLRRTIFLYESALPSSVLPNISGAESGANDGFEVLIDVERCPTDAGFLSSLFRTMQLHGMSGRHECALAVGRYLLSLDPLRDPMDVLVVLDYYALASTRRQRRTRRRLATATNVTANTAPTTLEVGETDDDDDDDDDDAQNDHEEEEECGAAFVVELIESNRITIHYIDPSTDRHHWCRLLDMPNFAFSYALAMYRLFSDMDGDGGRRQIRRKEEERQRADDALVDALRRFPLVLPKLLAMNRVNIEDRSCRADWPSVLPYFNADASHSASCDSANASEDRAARASGEHLVAIFVRRCHGLWKEDNILWWMYQCAVRVVREHNQPEQPNGDASPTHQRTPLVSTFSPALARYAKCDPSEYEDSFRTFPPEAIALNQNIVIPAMEVGLHGRRRFLRRGRQQQHDDEEELEQAIGREGAGGLVRQLLGLGGIGGGAAEVLDPDSPLLQLYMQSLLPWAQVEGVRPPARG